MSRLDALRGRFSPKRLIAGDPTPPPPSPLPPGGGQAIDPDGLAERRDALARELAELQWDLGGLAYEMAIRDHFRLDVLVRQAGRLQEVDAKLGEVEHLLRLDTTGAAGACPRCGTLYARGATFCSHCAYQLVGTQYAEQATTIQGGGSAPRAAAPQPPADAPSASASADDQPTWFDTRPGTAGADPADYQPTWFDERPASDEATRRQPNESDPAA